MIQKTNTPRIGIIGGMGNEAMVDVIKKLNRYCSPSTPFIAFGNSRLAYKPEELTHSWQSEDPPEKRKRDTASDILRFMQYLGVDSLGLACNSVHGLFREKLKEISLPFIDMLQHTAMTVENADKPVLIMDVDSIVQSGLYQSALNDVGVSLTKPFPDNQTKVIQAIYDPSFGIKTAKITEQAEKLLCDVINDEYQKYQTQKIVLGCTELPLVLTAKSILRFKQDKKLPHCIEVIDASEILAQALASQLPSTTQHRVVSLFLSKNEYRLVPTVNNKKQKTKNKKQKTKILLPDFKCLAKKLI